MKKIKKVQRKGSTFEKAHKYAQQYSTRMKESGRRTVKQTSKRMGEQKI